MGTDKPYDALDDFFAHSADAVFIADQRSVVLRQSEPFASLLGRATCAGMKLSDSVHPDDRQAFDERWATLNESSKPAQLAFRLQAADGSVRHVVCRARRSAARGEVHGSLREEGYAAALFDAGSLLHLFEEHLPICVWAVDRQGTLHVPCGQGDLDGRAHAGAVPWAERLLELYAGNEEGLIGVRKGFAGEIWHSYNESHNVSWENWHIPIRDQRGEIAGVAGITIDLSEARRAEKVLEEKLALIERQQQVIRALGTPIIEIWSRVLTVPLLGVVDSVRADEVMLITGIQPSVAQAMVMLGIELGSIVTFATLRGGLEHCMSGLRAREA